MKEVMGRRSRASHDRQHRETVRTLARAGRTACVAPTNQAFTGRFSDAGGGRAAAPSTTSAAGLNLPSCAVCWKRFCRSRPHSRTSSWTRRFPHWSQGAGAQCRALSRPCRNQAALLAMEEVVGGRGKRQERQRPSLRETLNLTSTRPLERGADGKKSDGSTKFTGARRQRERGCAPRAATRRGHVGPHVQRLAGAGA
jgi:hypothetical protein